MVRQTYDHTDPELAAACVDEIARDFTDENMPVEVRRLQPEFDGLFAFVLVDRGAVAECFPYVRGFRVFSVR